MDTDKVLSLVQLLYPVQDEVSSEVEMASEDDEMLNVEPDTLLSLPWDVLQHIFSFLSVTDSACCARVSRAFNRCMTCPFENRRITCNVVSTREFPLPENLIHRTDLLVGSCFMYHFKLPAETNPRQKYTYSHCDINLRVVNSLNCHYRIVGTYRKRVVGQYDATPFECILVSNFYETRVAFFCAKEGESFDEADRKRIESLFVGPHFN